MVLATKLVMDGEMPNQCSKSRFRPNTPPSVTPDMEWTWYSPNAKMALPSTVIRQEDSLLSLKIC